VKPAPAGFWEARLQPFLHRYSVLLTLAFVAIASARIVSTYNQLTTVDDEPGHFACGLEWLAKHRYQYEAQHPPLQRVLDAVGPYLAGVRPIGGPDRNDEGANVILATGNVDRTLFLMRLGVLPCFWILCLTTYLWARRYWDGAVGVLAVACLTLAPPVLGHAGLATTDIALTAFVPAAFLAVLVWAEAPTLRNAIVLGVMWALAVLSKFTALGFLPAAVLLMAIIWWAARRPSWKKLFELVRARAAGFGIALLTGAVTVWAGYWFSFGEVPGWNVRLPAPEFFQGISEAMRHAKEGHDADAYLLGETSPTGFWHFFLVALALKTPIALVLLMIAGLVGCWRRWRTIGAAAVFAFTFGILLSTIPSRLNIGIRHVLPVYAGLSIAAALALMAVMRMNRTACGVTGMLVIWAAVSGARAHPDYISYFNEVAASEPERFLVQSDLDWGQSKKLLGARLRALGATQVASRANTNPLTRRELYPLGPHTIIDDFHRAPGWAVISANDRVLIKHADVAAPILGGTDYQSVLNLLQPQQVTNRRPWYESAQPTERFHGYLLFYTPPDGR
jgi:hypothetical protein